MTSRVFTSGAVPVPSLDARRRERPDVSEAGAGVGASGTGAGGAAAAARRRAPSRDHVARPAQQRPHGAREYRRRLQG